MSQTLAAWLAASLGRRITAAGGLGGQCVDLANSYIAACYGLRPVRRNAVDWRQPGALPAGWHWEPNGPTNFPPCGALAVWGPAYTWRIAEGHIAVALVADAEHLVSVDQNWSNVEKAAVVVHDYRGLLGWWRPPPAPSEA